MLKQNMPNRNNGKVVTAKQVNRVIHKTQYTDICNN